MIDKEPNKLYYTVHLPMKGFSNEQIENAFKVIEDEVSKKFNVKCERINTFNPAYRNKPILGLSHSLACIHEADLCVFIEGWDITRGCSIEHEVAKRYHKALMYIRFSFE